MNISHTRRRAARRGGILAAAMLFFVMVTVAGTCILSMSTIQRIRTIRNGIDVRLMIACEAGVETVRGRFTLVAGVQENWNWLSDTTWTAVDTVVVNGTNVQVQALRFTDPSVPRARVRGFATASGKTRYVEETIKVAAFSDYAVFIGEASASHWGYFKCVGNFYSVGSCNFGATGTQFFGNAWTSGNFTKSGNSDPDSYTYLKGNLQGVPVITMPDDVANYTAIENGAKPPYLSSDHVYYENTLEIQLMGTQYRRIYVRRNSSGTAGEIPPSWQAAGSTTAPAGYPGGGSYGLIPGSQVSAASGWCDTGGLGNGTDGFYRGGLNIKGAPRAWNDATVTGTATSDVSNTWYQLAWETLDIPNNGVIYVKLGSPAADGSNDDTDLPGSYPNRYTQRGINQGDLQRNTPTSRSDSGRTPVLLLSGYLTDRRVTICGDGVNMVVRDNIIYNSYANDPGLRREANKTSSSALAVPEMLGVISRERWSNQASKSGTYLGGGDINMAYRYWNLLPTAWTVTNIAGDTGHLAAQNCLDGVFLGTRTCGDNYYHSSPPTQEVWFAGGLISLYTTYYTENCWSYVHYDWDWRMQETTPPFFLSSYNVSATFVPGSWRTWTG
ncbi:MAG: hypothetical protein H6839_11425 [Planctomycetes bacterium]|nr:hypothetical protein [Planctomycetota bacterium]